MLKNAQLGKEIVITVANKIGILADVSKILAEHGINIEAVAGYAEKDGNAKIMLVTADNLRASDALIKAGYKSAKENEIVILGLENKAGALKMISGILAAEGVDIKYIYGTACSGECPARMVLSTTDNEKALVAFKK